MTLAMHADSQGQGNGKATGKSGATVTPHLAILSVEPTFTAGINGQLTITGLNFGEAPFEGRVSFFHSDGHEDYVDLVSARIDGVNPDLILTLTDGTTLNAGAVGAPFMEFITVGNPGNAPDPLTGYGAVGDTYQIGKYEVTNAQFAAFLNAVAATEDPNRIYSGSLRIARTGPIGNFSYAAYAGGGRTNP